ncbi:MAG: M16 family metallopeptidase [Leptospirillia bacterium]
MPYIKHTLSNGLAVYSDPVTSSRSAAIGVWVRAGSRFELPSEAGMTHFLEHMCFKGTPTRNAQQIANEMDHLGGEMNAFTSQEMTCFYAHLLSENVSRAALLLGDLLTRSVFDAEELSRERGVVIEEIAESRDDPEDQVTQNLYEVHFGNHPLARPILGTERSLTSFSREHVGEYFRRNYHSGSMFVTVSGRFSWPALREALEEAFLDLPKAPPHATRPEVPFRPAYKQTRQDKKLEQVHVAIGMPGLSVAHPDQTLLRLMNVHLGGGMSSRLFQEVREKRGLAYSVYSTGQSFSDGGLLRIAASTRPSKQKELLEILGEEIARLETVPLSGEELSRAKNQVKSSLLIGLESIGTRMNKMGRDILYWGEEVPVETIESLIDAATPDDILSFAQGQGFSGQRSLSVLGPEKE